MSLFSFSGCSQFTYPDRSVTVVQPAAIFSSRGGGGRINVTKDTWFIIFFSFFDRVLIGQVLHESFQNFEISFKTDVQIASLGIQNSVRFFSFF